MEINFKAIKFKIKLANDENTHENLLAYVTLTFQEESGEHFIVSGFTFWKSKFSGYNIEAPQRPGFKYCFISTTLKRKIEKEIIRKYEDETIPVINENESNENK